MMLPANVCMSSSGDLFIYFYFLLEIYIHIQSANDLYYKFLSIVYYKSVHIILFFIIANSFQKIPK